MTNPLISIIIPVYNHAHTIQRSLVTIAAQSYRPLEVILVDDGSTDNFREIEPELLKTFSQKDIALKIFHQENFDAGVARNRGFRESVGEYVIFWDADTLGTPEMIHAMYDALKEHPEATYAYSRFKFGWKIFKSSNFSEKLLRTLNYIDTTSLIRRNDFSGFDITLKKSQDWDLWLTLLEQGKTGIFVPEILYTKVVKGRKGKSAWIPSFFYKLPWKVERRKAYEASREAIIKKHSKLTFFDL